MNSANPADYALNHWLKFESAEEHAERVEHCEAFAYPAFKLATAPQKAIYDQAMSDLRGLSGPRYDRAREAAKSEWYRSTKAARDLFNRTCDHLMRGGDEADEAIDAEWTALINPPRLIVVGDHDAEAA